MAAIKAGPLTRAELQAIWKGSTDRGYSEPLEQAGDGAGFEAWSQFFAQLERASKAIDVTTQAMFISPWSGQTNPSAAGAKKATATLTFSRTRRLDRALVLGKGMIFVGEKTTDAGQFGPEDVETGRLYVLLQDVVFQPGERGPFSVAAEAERPGFGYNNPLPGTIKAVRQPSSAFTNDLATVTSSPQPSVQSGPASRQQIVADAQPDMFVPDHVGQYLVFTAGSNAGAVARITSFVPPKPTSVPPVGSAADLEIFFSVELQSVVGAFVEGEVLVFATPASTGRVIGRFDAATKRLAFALSNGTAPAVNSTVTGVQSGATGTVKIVLQSTVLAAEAPTAGGGATWRILDWVDDWGLTATNVASPSGGVAPMLDELGNERGVSRGAGEDDLSYRARIREIADVVSPNAIKRALVRTLGAVGWCLREAGSSKLPGFFYDGTGEQPSAAPHGSANDAYDYDTWTFPGSTVGTFAFQERVFLEDAVTDVVYVEGWVGGVAAGPVFTLIRKNGTVPSSMAGLRFRGATSGATFTPSSAVQSAQSEARRYRAYLDIEQFRAFFVVSVSTLTAGEFGFAYDATTKLWGYDLPMPWGAAFDGSPAAAAAIYKRAYDEVDKTRAGGVGFGFRRDDGLCT